jgi:trehalose-6-phosphatase
MIRSLIQAEKLDLQVLDGNADLEIRPRLEWDKGAALRWVHERIKSEDALTLVFGAHGTDLCVFRAIDGAITVGVGPGQCTSAQYQLDGPKALTWQLGWLLEQWTERLDEVDASRPTASGRPVLALKEASPILNVRLRRAAIDRRRRALG